MVNSEARHIAIDILSRRDNSAAEMRSKLKRKGIPEEDVEDTIVWLTGKKLLNDAEFARKRAESIFRMKLCGPRFIAHKLREARISSEIIERTVDDLATGEQWSKRAHDAIDQWRKAHPKHKDDAVRQARFLASRGFDGYV